MLHETEIYWPNPTKIYARNTHGFAQTLNEKTLFDNTLKTSEKNGYMDIERPIEPVDYFSVLRTNGSNFDTKVTCIFYSILFSESEAYVRTIEDMCKNIYVFQQGKI